MTTGRASTTRFLALRMLGGTSLVACLAACSTSTGAQADPTCDTEGGARLHGGFCVVAELPSENDATVASDAVSFSRDVQPLLTHYCGVVGCHVSGSPTGGLNLAPGFAYDQLLDAQPGELQVLPNEAGALYYVAAGDLDHSYLHIKIHPEIFDVLKDAEPPALQGRLGSEMPAKATGSILDPAMQIELIDQWIDAGAPRN
jgi:hypothetical protein